MKIKLGEIAGFVGGKLTGSYDIVIEGMAKIQEAAEGELTFLYMPAYEKYFPYTKASAILVNPGFDKSRNDIAYIEVKDPNKAFSKILIKYFTPEIRLSGIDRTAFIHPGASVGESTALGKNVVIESGCKIGNNVRIFHNTVVLEGSEIGDDCVIFQNVSIREKCKIGKRVIIHPGTVVGSDGFGFFADEKGVYNKIPQIGNVVIEDDVELGANVCIDRAAIGSTVIKRGVKIDNLVQIAHNVVIDEDTVISAQSGVSGSTKVGKHCMLAGQVGIVGHVEITDDVIVYAQSGISKGISKPGQYFGSPAKEAKTAIKLEAHYRNLPSYVEKIKNLEEEIKKLREEINSAKK